MDSKSFILLLLFLSSSIFISQATPIQNHPGITGQRAQNPRKHPGFPAVEDNSSPESAAKVSLPRRYLLAEDNNSSHNHKQEKTKRWALGFSAGVVVGGGAGFLFSFLVKTVAAIAKKKKSNGMTIFSPLIKTSKDLGFLLKEDGLAGMEMIGRGGCGEVYKAELPNGKIFAIKKIIQPPKEASEMDNESTRELTKKMQQIRSEIQTVGRVRHRNLLPLLAHVSRPDCHYLVYEFMKNGSLQDLLNKHSNGNGELTWLARYRIAEGVARGLEYLHVSNNPKIIHRDLKPGNILLDEEMEARIADFGLARPMPDAETHVTSSNVAGTLGYVAPEYHQTMRFTEKCDVYGFGVVLGVLVVGRLPWDEFFVREEGVGLVKWMRRMMVSGEAERVIDPRLVGVGFDEQMMQVLKIACFCTADNPRERPSSKDVRLMLSQIKH